MQFCGLILSSSSWQMGGWRLYKEKDVALRIGPCLTWALWLACLRIFFLSHLNGHEIICTQK